MSIDTLSADDEHGPSAGRGDQRDHLQRKRRPKRPSVAAMIKAAKAAGLEIASIECDAAGVKLVCGKRAPPVDTDDVDLDRRMTEQMGVARMGGRARR